MDRALALIEEGELSKAARLLTSSGPGSLSDQRTTAQLEATHQRCETTIDADLSRFGPIEDTAVDLT